MRADGAVCPSYQSFDNNKNRKHYVLILFIIHPPFRRAALLSTRVALPISMSSKNDALDGHPKYERIRGLGKGQFGNVQLCRRKADGREVAIKLLALDAFFHEDNVQKEILNHRLLVHNHIVEFYEVFVFKSHLCIVMEFCKCVLQRV